MMKAHTVRDRFRPGDHDMGINSDKDLAHHIALMEQNLKNKEHHISFLKTRLGEGQRAGRQEIKAGPGSRLYSRA